MDNERAYLSYSIVFDKIEELLKQNTRIIVAIDGMCGSGKSYLADLLAGKYDCNVFHMDDFYLPLDMRTKERLEEPGGNVHYERFKEEVLDPICENRPVIYRPYLCGVWKFDEPRTIQPKKLNIIEGSYSMHPLLRDAYDLSVFLEIDQEDQIRRIAQRSGEDSLKQFINRWIPLGNKYFSEMNIKSVCDIKVSGTVNKM